MAELLRRELLIAFRRRAEMLNPLWFFIIVITLFPLSLGADSSLLTKLAPAIIWVGALLAVVVSLERLFRDDYSDGALEQLLLMPEPLPLLVFAKVLVHWLVTGFPLLVISPLLAILLSFDWSMYKVVFTTLLLGTPTLSFLGAVGTALTVGIKRGGVLVSLLVLPLFIPVLIFATSAIDMASSGLAINGQLAILGAMLVGSATLMPFAIAAGLRVSVQ